MLEWKHPRHEAVGAVDVGDEAAEAVQAWHHAHLGPRHAVHLDDVVVDDVVTVVEARAALFATSHQGLTLVHFSPLSVHFLWDKSGARDYTCPLLSST